MTHLRVFTSQDTLDAWVSGELADLDGDRLTLSDGGAAFALEPAVLFTDEVTDSGDAAALIGKVKCLSQLPALGAEHYADSVLLDNMSPEQVADCVARAAELQGASPRRCLLEASGGINLDTIAAYAATGVDLLSAGWLTHSAPTLDVALDIDIQS